MSSPSAPLQVLVCQFNPVVGDLEGNARRILEACAVAHGQGRQLVVTPELALSGYPPEDLLLRPAFMARCESLVQEIAQATSAWPGLRLVLGHPAGRADGTAPVAAADRSVQDRRVLNAASVLGDGAVLARHVKRELPLVTPVPQELGLHVMHEAATGQGVQAFEWLRSRKRLKTHD